METGEAVLGVGTVEAAEDAALAELLTALDARGYGFVTPGNGTIAIVRGRRETARARHLRDVLGWSLPFTPGEIDAEIEALLSRAGRVEAVAGGLRATVRVSTAEGALFLHSAYPTSHRDAVFLGPDTYRFAAFLRTELGDADAAEVRSVLDIGAGAGVGGVVAARLTGATTVTLSDINPGALRLARVNAAHAGVAATLRRGSGVEGMADRFDLIVSNPPFIAEGGKVYSDGGGLRGAALSLEWATAGMARLNPGGRLLMYTGSPIVEGQDALREALGEAARPGGCTLGYRELDPDIFGGSLERPVYAEVERIAAVGVTLTRTA